MRGAAAWLGDHEKLEKIDLCIIAGLKIECKIVCKSLGFYVENHCKKEHSIDREFKASIRWEQASDHRLLFLSNSVK